MGLNSKTKNIIVGFKFGEPSRTYVNCTAEQFDGLQIGDVISIREKDTFDLILVGGKLEGVFANNKLGEVIRKQEIIYM